MIIFVLREDSRDTGVAFAKFRDAAAAAANLSYAEIVRADLRKQGAALHCALFNHELGEDARIVAVVNSGRVMILNQKQVRQETCAWRSPLKASVD